MTPTPEERLVGRIRRRHVQEERDLWVYVGHRWRAEILIAEGRGRNLHGVTELLSLNPHDAEELARLLLAATEENRARRAAVDNSGGTP